MVKILSSGIPILNIEDLPKSEFRISINRKIITNLINNVKLKSNELYKKFSTTESQKGNKIKSIKRSFLMDWKKGKTALNLKV